MNRDASAGPDPAHRHLDAAPSATVRVDGRSPDGDGGDDSALPWVETRPGGLFFVNAILVSPIVMALYPWSLRWLLRVTGILDRPSRILDPVPAVAAHFAPVVGWLSLPAAWLVWKNLRIVDRGWARALLWGFLVLHLGMVVYTVRRWL